MKQPLTPLFKSPEVVPNSSMLGSIREEMFGYKKAKKLRRKNNSFLKIKI